MFGIDKISMYCGKSRIQSTIINAQQRLRSTFGYTTISMILHILDSLSNSVNVNLVLILKLVAIILPYNYFALLLEF